MHFFYGDFQNACIFIAGYSHHKESIKCKYKSEFNLTACESADKAPLNTLTSGTTPKARAFLLKGEGPSRPRAGASREKTCRRTRARPLILTWEATVKAGRLERGAGPSVWAPDKPCGWELLGGVPWAHHHHHHPPQPVSGPRHILTSTWLRQILVPWCCSLAWEDSVWTRQKHLMSLVMLFFDGHQI